MQGITKKTQKKGNKLYIYKLHSYGTEDNSDYASYGFLDIDYDNTNQKQNKC